MMLFSALLLLSIVTISQAANPIVNTMYTADPAALVYNDSLFLFTGHDEQGPEGPNNEWFRMLNWHVFVTDDMENYHDYGPVLSPQTFSWASGNAFAGHCEYHNGKFYWYVAVTHATIKEDEGFAIGVAVADHPSGAWTDAIGEALVTDYTPNDIALNIDPAIYIDNGTPWLYWGSWGSARRVKLKDNMTELDGSVETVQAAGFFEAPWIHKYNGMYYLSYASGYPSTTNYSVSRSINGPWDNKGIINPLLENSSTNHQAIVKYLGHWYFIYHAANAPGGWTYRRAVNIDYLYYDDAGDIQTIQRTTTGVDRVDNALIAEGVYKLKPAHSELYLEANENILIQNNDASENLQNQDAQLWQIVQSQNSKRYYTLQNLGTGEYLCAGSPSLLDSLRFDENPCEIRIENASAEAGYYLFTDYEKDYVADVLNTSTDPGMPLISWIRTGNDNQKIQLEYIRDVGPVSARTQKSILTPKNLGQEPEIWSLYNLQGETIRHAHSREAILQHLAPGCYILKSGTFAQMIYQEK